MRDVGAGMEVFQVRSGIEKLVVKRKKWPNITLLSQFSMNILDLEEPRKKRLKGHFRGPPLKNA